MFDLKTASRISGIKRQTLWRACWELRLRARRVRIGRSFKWLVTRSALREYEESFAPCNIKVRHIYARRVLSGESPESVAHDQSIKVRSVYRALNREGITFNNKREMVMA